MTTQQIPFEQLQVLAQRFIDVANKMKDEGQQVEVVNSALMLASGIYATYSTVGNDSYLKEGGIEKVTTVFKNNLASLQQIKKSQLNPDNKS